MTGAQSFGFFDDVKVFLGASLPQLVPSQGLRVRSQQSQKVLKYFGGDLSPPGLPNTAGGEEEGTRGSEARLPVFGFLPEASL